MIRQMLPTPDASGAALPSTALRFASELPQTQRERLAFLELWVHFCGELRRSDLERRFGIKPAAATRDLNAYRALAPDNLTYDASIKAYVPSSRFAPVFGFTPDRVLAWLRHGFGDGLELSLGQPIPCDGVAPLAQPSLDTLATLTRAIHLARPVQISYLSLSSGMSKRVVVPGALAENGSRWHLRAFDRGRCRHADFVLARISKAKLLDEGIDDEERLAADAQWAKTLDLELVPHPGLAHPKAIGADYGISKNGVLRMNVRAAMAGYALNRWHVDCSVDHSLDCAQHHLWLRNRHVLDGVESARLAPGYGESNEID